MIMVACLSVRLETELPCLENPLTYIPNALIRNLIEPCTCTADVIVASWISLCGNWYNVSLSEEKEQGAIPS